MKNRTAVVASLVAFALAVAPASAFAGGRHHGGGLIWGFANAVVATAAAVITAPIAILAAVAHAPPYYAPGPAYAGASPVYDTPTPRYYGRPAAPTYYGAPQTAPYYAPATVPADYTPPAATYYAPPRIRRITPPGSPRCRTLRLRERDTTRRRRFSPHHLRTTVRATPITHRRPAPTTTHVRRTVAPRVRL